jgi:23S rRNA (cytidine1920-2'-O)/16S rRNA (cytidine1409-2'-O)-methyltransferase
MRLDTELNKRGLVFSRSQAENYVKLGLVKVNGKVVTKPGFVVQSDAKLELISDQYVSRAALKLASIAGTFSLDFRDSIVLDVGSSTGGFTDFALQHGAKKVIAVDVGSDQLHPSLRNNSKVELYEKTDIREFASEQGTSKRGGINIILTDVSFISLRYILPSLKLLANSQTRLLIMCKPQFEAGRDQVNKGIIKNSAIRRNILKDFETWLTQNGFIVLNKADSQVAGTKGNVERFYKLKLSKGKRAAGADDLFDRPAR